MPRPRSAYRGPFARAYAVGVMPVDFARAFGLPVERLYRWTQLDDEKAPLGLCSFCAHPEGVVFADGKSRCYGCIRTLSLIAQALEVLGWACGLEDEGHRIDTHTALVVDLLGRMQGPEQLPLPMEVAG